MRIFQLLHTLNYGDAISGEALIIKRELCKIGIESKIFGLNAHDNVKSEMHDWKDLGIHIASAEKCSDVVCVLLHYSIGSPLNALYKGLKNVRRVLIYHNLTPAHWFANYNARVYEDLREGLSELPDLLAVSELVLADSDFNKAELEKLGRNDVFVLPLALDEEKWSVSENPGIVNVLACTKINWLHVGRIAPNKCVEDIIKAFYFYQHKICKCSKLWLIGHDIDTEIYSFELRRIVAHLHLELSVSFVGAISDAELKAFYRHSHVYMCMSEHEGFCVPLLEAMYFGLPVIAYNNTAIGQTLGEAGLLLNEKFPSLIAELANEVVMNENLRQELIANGRERSSHFCLGSFMTNLKNVLQYS